MGHGPFYRRPRFSVIMAGALCCASALDVLADDRIAVVDVAFDTRPYLTQLRDVGVKVIGRYYGRCKQWDGKRLVDQGGRSDPASEINGILSHFGVLSVYQFLSSSKYKFSGLLDANTPLPDAQCNKQAAAHSTEVEARLDAEAAVSQAKAVGQPKDTAIYFAVDFEVAENDHDTHGKLGAYFKTVSARLKQEGFKVGAYGSGLALDLLKEVKLDDGHAAVSLFWLSPSRSFPGSIDFFNRSAWHLLQNSVDLQWFSVINEGKCAGLALDTNIQNPAFANAPIGFWTTTGEYKVDVQRTTDIFANRRFACHGKAVIRNRPDANARLVDMRNCVRAYVKCEASLPGQVTPQVCHGHSVRIGKKVDEFYQVDYNDDGHFDGFVDANHLTRSFTERPAYGASDAARREAVCP